MQSLTIEQALKQAYDILADTSDSHKVDARMLLCHVLAQNPTYLYTWPDKILAPEQLQSFDHCVARRAKGEPVAYITGERGFWSFSLKTNDSTLIPREETECLVECALTMVNQSNAKVLDLGTGTGAIALALAVERPGWQVLACDYNADAVDLAKDNAQTLNIDNIAICQSDWFTAFQGHESSFDMIVSNPPYVAPDDPHLKQGDLRFEPVGALAAKDQGFADIFHIIDKARAFLKPGGVLMIEHGFEQGAQIRQQFVDSGYQQVSTKKDLSDLERFSLGLWAD